MTKANEAALVTGLRRSDPRAFETLVREFGPRLINVASRMLGSQAEAEDAVQESLILVWKNIGGFAGESGLGTWLHRIVINACLARMRSSRSTREVPLSDGARPVAAAFEGLATAWPDSGLSMEKRLAMRRSIERALADIPLEYRTVLLLRDVEELSSKETAEQLGITDALVRQRLHRARTIMAEMLRPELCEGPELTCGGQLDLLLDYIDQGLPESLQVPVREHIEGCPACSGLLDGYRLTVGLPRAIAELTDSGDLAPEFVAATVALATA